MIQSEAPPMIAPPALVSLESTGALRGYQSAVKFQLGTGFFPKSNVRLARAVSCSLDPPRSSAASNS
jgi:hypothetical protein